MALYGFEVRTWTKRTRHLQKCYELNVWTNERIIIFNVVHFFFSVDCFVVTAKFSPQKVLSQEMVRHMDKLKTTLLVVDDVADVLYEAVSVRVYKSIKNYHHGFCCRKKFWLVRWYCFAKVVECCWVYPYWVWNENLNGCMKNKKLTKPNWKWLIRSKCTNHCCKLISDPL